MGVKLGDHATFRISGRVVSHDINLREDDWVFDTVDVINDDGALVTSIPLSAQVSDAPTVSPELVDRMVELVDRMVRLVRVIAGCPPPPLNDPAHDWWKSACIIVADLPPEPVDPLVQRAREICAAESPSFRDDYPEPHGDDTPMMRAVLAALRYQSGRKP